jgi:tetratricopeptide (TPR) repeat protein
MQAGTVLSQRYRIDSQLGEGGMGVVYGAHDTLLQRPVAIKTLSPTFLGPDGARRFLREAQAVARLNHPHIVSIYDAVEEGGTFAIVMERVEGKTLRETMPVPVDRLIEITRQILQALEFAHGQGIVHRDIKPENIIITIDGTAKLMDFGLARSEGRSRMTQTGMIVGTVAYLAPEQALGGQVDARSDLYSLGAVLYEAVAGKPPFESDDPVSVITQHINVPPVAPHWHNAAVPQSLENIVLKLLAKDPARRFQTAQEVLAALTSVTPSGAVSVQTPERLAGPQLVGQIAPGVLVGRDADLARLRELIEATVAGRGGVAVVTGPLGIGKTGLIEEAITFARLRGVTVVTGKAYESAPPYEPFARTLRDLARGVDSDTLAARLGDAAPEFVALIPELARQLPRLSESASGSPDDRKNRLFAGVAQFLGATGAATPILLFLDDMHLADAATVELLQHVARRADASRLLLVVAYRSDEVPSIPAGRKFAQLMHALGREEFCTTLTLHPLTEDQVIDLIKVMASHPTRPVVFGRRIFETTEGNPYFIEEVIKGLFEQGTLYIKDGQWSTDLDDAVRAAAADYSMLSVPSSVHGAVEARLRTLNEQTRQMLTSAAVIGKQFSFDVLLAVAGTDETTLLDRVEEALRAQLIREVRGAGEDVYEFAQPMLRRVLYESIPRRRRRLLHRQIGETLEQTAARRLEPHLEALTQHFSEGEVPEKTLQYARRAAQKAAVVFAYDDAAAYLRIAIAAADELDATSDRLAMMELLGDLAHRAGERQETIRAWEDAVQFWRSLPDGSRDDGARLYRKLGEVGTRWSIYNPRVREHIQDGLKLLEDSPQHPERIKLVLAKAFDQFWQRPAAQVDIHLAEATAQEGYRLAEAAGSLEDMSAALDALAGIYVYTADFQKALEVSLRRVPIVQRLGEPHEQVDLHHMLAWTYEQVGRFPEAATQAEEGVAVAKRSGIVGYRTQMIWDATRISTKWGRWDPVRGWANELADIERRYGSHDRRRGHILAAVGRIAALRGKPEDAAAIMEELETIPPPGNPALGWGAPFSKLLVTLAIPDVERSRSLVEEGLRMADAPWTKLEVGIMALEYAALSGEWAHATQLGDELLQTARTKGMRYHLAVICRAMGAYYRASGRLGDAEALLGESQDLFRAMDCPWELGRSHRELALLRRDQGRTDEATVLLKDALALFEALGAAPDVDRTRELM